MPAEQRRSWRVLLPVALLGCGMLFALPLNRGALPETPIAISPTLLDAPQLQLRFGRERLSISGTSASPEHEAALLQLATEYFADAEITTDFRPTLAATPDWEILSTRLLYLVAATRSAAAVLDAERIAIRGVSDNPSGYASRRTFLQEAISDHRVLDSDVITISAAVSLDELCRRSFSTLLREPIQFRQTSTSLRQSSLPSLDRLAEFALDCRAQKIAIIGHTDSTGDAGWNLQVSRARADAVALNLVQRGVPRERLIVEGRGAAQPLADNGTVYGREQNRRIELELR